MKDFNKFNKIWDNPQLKQIFETQQQMYQMIEHTGLTKILENNLKFSKPLLEATKNLKINLPNNLMSSTANPKNIMNSLTLNNYELQNTLASVTASNNAAISMINREIFDSFYSINSVIKDLSIYSQQHNLVLKSLAPNFFHMNKILNQVINMYNISNKDEVEVVVENISVVIMKSNLQEYIEIFKNLKIPDAIAVKLSFISYFILKFAPLIYVLPALIPFMGFLLKLFIIYGKPYIKALSKLKDPEVFAEKAADNTFSILLSSIISILGTLFINKKK